MNRVMIWAAALTLMVAGMAVSQQEASAGLFNRKSNCCKPQKCRQGLFAKRRAQKCCEPAPCCAPEPCCVAAAPVCAPAPAPCGCEAAAPCGCTAAAPAPCGCEAAPACGCQTASCDCLNRRQLRRANRKGECCGAQANTCNTCSAAVQTVGYAAPVSGCSSCGGEVIIESSPTPAAGEEAAPEAPEAPKSNAT